MSWNPRAAPTSNLIARLPSARFLSASSRNSPHLVPKIGASCVPPADAWAAQFALSGVVAGGSAAGGPPREDATAEERALQGAVTVHAAAAETGGLTGGVQPVEHHAARPQHPGIQVGF